MKINTVIIPAAGLGTRFLPYTKAVPKEMLPLGNKPAIQLIIEEGIQSNICNFCIIINQDKKDIYKYFHEDASLENLLREHGKLPMLQSVKDIEQKSTLSYIEQLEPLGLGHAILIAQDKIGDTYFGIMLPDDVIFGDSPALQQIITIACQYQASVIAVQEVPEEHVASYGIVGIKQQISQNLFEVNSLVEKPEPNKAPSGLGIIGRYILSPKIFNALSMLQSKETQGELQLTDAISLMMQQHNEKVYAYKVDGIRHDIGNPDGWFKAIIDIARKESKYASLFSTCLKCNY